MGKTQWARSIANHMYFAGMFMLDLWDDEAQYAIFDDWNDWSKMYFYKQFMGGQKEFIISDKYRRKTNKRWGKPCIIIANEYPRFDDMAWINLNVISVEIKSPLF